MRHNLNGQFGHNRTKTRPHMAEVETLVRQRMKLELELIKIAGDAGREFIRCLPDDPKAAMGWMETELQSYECTCGVSRKSFPCAGCEKRAALREQEWEDRVDYVLDALVDF